MMTNSREAHPVSPGVLYVGSQPEDPAELAALLALKQDNTPLNPTTATVTTQKD